MSNIYGHQESPSLGRPSLRFYGLCLNLAKPFLDGLSIAGLSSERTCTDTSESEVINNDFYDIHEFLDTPLLLPQWLLPLLLAR